MDSVTETLFAPEQALSALVANCKFVNIAEVDLVSQLSEEEILELHSFITNSQLGQFHNVWNKDLKTHKPAPINNLIMEISTDIPLYYWFEAIVKKVMNEVAEKITQETSSG